jgi:hypothetical protein
MRPTAWQVARVQAWLTTHTDHQSCSSEKRREREAERYGETPEVNFMKVKLSEIGTIRKR